MKRTWILAVLFTWVCSAAALAQGSGSTNFSPEPIGQPSSPVGREEPFNVTRTIKGMIVELNVDENQIVVEDKKGRRLALRIGTETEYKAAKKTELADKKDLTLRDFRVGHPVRVVYLVEQETTVEIRLLKK
jgi:hypothetical protein